MRKVKRVFEEQPFNWYLPYCSLIILIVSLFVMLCSYATFTRGRLRQIQESFRSAVTLPELRVLFFGGTHPRVRPGDDEQMVRERVTVPLQKFLKGRGLEEFVFLKTTRDFIGFTVLDAVLFAPGETQLLPGGRRILGDIGALLRDTTAPVYIEGHTDDAVDGWHRTALKAAAVMRYLREGCGIPQQRLFAAGYSAFRPFVPNASLEERRRNRRIELLIPLDEATFTKRGGIGQDPPPSFKLWDLRARTGGAA